MKNKVQYNGKLWKNIWLISLIVLAVSFGVLFTGSFFTGKPQEGFMADLFSFGIIFSLPIGIISFVIWLLVPGERNLQKFLNKSSRIASILLGIIFAIQFTLTVRSVLYIYSYDNWNGNGIYDLFALLAFILVCFIWFKTKRLIYKLTIVLVLIGAYFLGRVYALRTFQTFTDAQNLFIQTNSDNKMSWKNETDPYKYLAAEGKYVASLKTAAETPKDSLRWGKTYFENHYQIQKELLEYDEKLLTGELVLTKEESEKIISESNARVTTLSQQGYMLPFWTDFFMVK